MMIPKPRKSVNTIRKIVNNAPFGAAGGSGVEYSVELLSVMWPETLSAPPPTFTHGAQHAKTSSRAEAVLSRSRRIWPFRNSRSLLLPQHHQRKHPHPPPRQFIKPFP